MEFLPLQWLRNVPEVGSGQVSLPYDLGFDPQDFTPPAVLPARDTTPKGGNRLRKGNAVAPQFTALNSTRWELIARRSLIEPALAAAQADVNLIPLALTDEQGPLESDFVLIDPRQRIPMDRDASEAEYDHPDNPHGSVTMGVRRLGWGPGRTPRTPVFRLAEHPAVIVARADVAAAIQAATRGAIAPVPAPYPYTPGPVAPVFDRNPQPQLSQSGWFPYCRAVPVPETAPAALGPRAAEAFFRLYAGEGRPGDRELVLSHPHYNHFLAALVDRDANDDTGAAALAHPHYAFRYSNEVDRCARDDNRLAAAKHPTAALAYTKYLDFLPHPATQAGASVPALQGSYEQALERGAKVLAWRRGERPAPPAPPAAPRPQAPREWPPHAQPRYAEDGATDGPKPGHSPLDAELRSDIDAFTEKGLALAEVEASGRPEAIALALHGVIDARQKKTKKFPKKQQAVMAIACAFGEQLHRALGYRWAQVRNADGSGGVALISPDASVAVYPLFLVERLFDPKATSNTLLLTFNLLADGKLPPGTKPGAYLAMT